MAEEDIRSIVSKVRLKDSDDNGEFRPFIVNFKSNPALKNIIKSFNQSNEIKLGYSTIQKDKGIIEPTMKRKNLFLTGGALRDHLKNKAFYNYDCVTDASPDEIRKILLSPLNQLVEVKPDTHDIELLEKYKKLPDRGQRKKFFAASRWDKEGHEIELCAEIDGQKVFISPFSLHTKDRMVSPPQRSFATSMEEDAKTRDLTMNALYLKLKNDDGENAELSDPEGGIHDLKNGDIRLIQSSEKTFDKDPYLPFRICLIAARYSPDHKVPENVLYKIKRLEGIKVDPKSLKRILLSGLNNPDVPVFYFIKNLHDCNLIQHIFPHMHVEHPTYDLPNNKIVTIAYLLQKNDVETVKNMLVSRGFAHIDVENICKLVSLAKFSKNNIVVPELIYDIFTKPFNLPNTKIKEFLKLIGKERVFDTLFTGDLDEVLKKYVGTENSRQVNPMYVKMMGKALRPDELEDARKTVFHHKVHKLMSSANDQGKS